MDKNNIGKNKVSLKKIFYDDNKLDSIAPLKNNKLILEEKCP